MKRSSDFQVLFIGVGIVTLVIAVVLALTAVRASGKHAIERKGLVSVLFCIYQWILKL